jgi:epoxyqueuosine reductase
MDPKALKTTLIELCQNLGFDACKIAPASQALHAENFLSWIADGKHATMDWLAKNPQRRCDPKNVVENAQSVIVLATSYYQPTSPISTYQVSRYAWNQDYHDLLLPRLEKITEWIQSQGGKTRHYVDTGPVLERDAATLAGLGWNGKSAMQLSQELGTYFFLSVVITDLKIPIDEPVKNRCGTCTRCMVACPTQAIIAEHVVDARRCISYWTIENKEGIPLEYRSLIGNRLYGCDECLVVCPWNRLAKKSNEVAFYSRQSLFSKSLAELLELSPENFNLLFKGSPIKRIKWRGLIRNACIVAGNIKDTSCVKALHQLALNTDSMIAEHAQWALTQLHQLK